MNPRFNYIVRLPRKGGHGVLVNGVIFTAAHCLSFKITGEMVIGDYFLEEVHTLLGRFKVRPLAVEPCADIAVLGAVDGQVFPEDAEAFERFCQQVKPVRLNLHRYPLHSPFGVHIYNTKGKWIEGTATITNEFGPHVWLRAERTITGGASGGPVVTAKGELVTIVSNSSFGRKGGAGLAPRLPDALPVWVRRMVLHPS